MMFTGRLSALPPVTSSRDREYRLIRPLVFVTEDITRAYAEALGVPVVPCGCSQKTGTVRRALRDMFAELERQYPHLKENILSAMGNVDGGVCSIRGCCTWKRERCGIVPHRNGI
jgi:tRNA 2-thiocytidine biosynthesis protein TtcA